MSTRSSLPLDFTDPGPIPTLPSDSQQTHICDVFVGCFSAGLLGLRTAFREDTGHISGPEFAILLDAASWEALPRQRFSDSWWRLNWDSCSGRSSLQKPPGRIFLLPPPLLWEPKCKCISGFSDKQETKKTMGGRHFLYAYARSPDASVSELLSTVPRI